MATVTIERPNKPATIEERFWSKVNLDGPVPSHRPELGPCWEWVACKQSMGYGQFGVGGVAKQAHRVSYEMVNGPLPAGVIPHHLCENRPCVRPSHLEAVTHSQHSQRHGKKPPKRQRIRLVGGVCNCGDELSGQNVYIAPNGEVRCRACMRRWRRDYIERSRVKGVAVPGTTEHYRMHKRGRREGA